MDSDKENNNNNNDSVGPSVDQWRGVYLSERPEVESQKPGVHLSPWTWRTRARGRYVMVATTTTATATMMMMMLAPGWLAAHLELAEAPEWAPAKLSRERRPHANDSALLLLETAHAGGRPSWGQE